MPLPDNPLVPVYALIINLFFSQHVEGDGESALQWVLRADVERTSLLEDEQRLLEAQHSIHDGHSEAQEEVEHTKPNAKSKPVTSKSEAAGSCSSNGAASGMLGGLDGVNIELALAEVYERMEAIGVRSAEQRACAILRGLNFTDTMMRCPTNSLSGGWAMRAALAAALFVKPDLLLLDEVLCFTNCYCGFTQYYYFSSHSLSLLFFPWPALFPC